MKFTVLYEDRNNTDTVPSIAILNPIQILVNNINPMSNYQGLTGACSSINNSHAMNFEGKLLARNSVIKIREMSWYFMKIKHHMNYKFIEIERFGMSTWKKKKKRTRTVRLTSISRRARAMQGDRAKRESEGISITQRKEWSATRLRQTIPQWYSFPTSATFGLVPIPTRWSATANLLLLWWKPLSDQNWKETR